MPFFSQSRNSCTYSSTTTRNAGWHQGLGECSKLEADGLEFHRTLPSDRHALFDPALSHPRSLQSRPQLATPLLIRAEWTLIARTMLAERGHRHESQLDSILIGRTFTARQSLAKI
nr:hypothetical protein CFP56_64722 [Quercus suber]